MNQQKLQLWTSVAEIVSAIAIVISLLYVASEFRQSETVTEREADAELFDRVREANRILIENPDVAALTIAASRGPEELTAADRLRYLAIQHQFFDSWELAWGYHAGDVLGDELWEEWDGWFSTRAAELPSFAWAESRKHFGGSFRDHVDAIVGSAVETPASAPSAAPSGSEGPPGGS